ncbi:MULTISPECIES: OmpA family protein [unclassified Roseobacter]|uniref:OmpA family protein n=1 Tax=unclassified Roseobacter TaxID=196798 RepID=UPI0030EB4AB1
MARNRTRKRTKRRGNSPGAGIKLLAGLTVIGGLVGLVAFMLMLSKKPEIDLASGCSTSQPLDTTLIFVDDTTPLTETQSLRIKNIILDHSAVTPERHQVLLTSVQNALSNQIQEVGCLARDPSGSDFNNLTENRAILEDQRRAFLNTLTEWSDENISVGSYADYLADWAAQFTEAGVAVTTTDTEVRIVLSDTVTFDTGSDRLNLEGARIIENLGRSLSENDQFSVNIVGHTDNVGDPLQNQDLSERRATSVADIIVSEGIDAANVTIGGRGDAAPIASNANEEGRRLNRRVEITLAPKRLLLEALDRAFALLDNRSDRDGRIDIVMISDMAQSSPIFSVYDGQTWSEFIASSEGATLNLTPENLSISLYRILRQDTVTSKLAILDFWRNYFNAKSVRIATDQEI